MLAVWLAVRGFIGVIPTFVWKIIGAILICLIIFISGEIRGKRIATAECERKAAIAQKAANDQDLQAAAEVHEQDMATNSTLLEQDKANKDAIDDLQKKLASLHATCVYDKSTADPDSVRQQPSGKGTRH